MSVSLESLDVVEERHLITVCVVVLSNKNDGSFPLKTHRLDKGNFVELQRDLLLNPNSPTAEIPHNRVLPDVFGLISSTLVSEHAKEHLRVSCHHGFAEWKPTGSALGVKTKDFCVYFYNTLGNQSPTLSLYRRNESQHKEIPGIGSFLGILAFAPSHLKDIDIIKTELTIGQQLLRQHGEASVLAFFPSTMDLPTLVLQLKNKKTQATITGAGRQIAQDLLAQAQEARHVMVANKKRTGGAALNRPYGQKFQSVEKAKNSERDTANMSAGLSMGDVWEDDTDMWGADGRTGGTDVWEDADVGTDGWEDADVGAFLPSWGAGIAGTSYSSAVDQKFLTDEGTLRGVLLEPNSKSSMIVTGMIQKSAGNSRGTGLSKNLASVLDGQDTADKLKAKWIQSMTAQLKDKSFAKDLLGTEEKEWKILNLQSFAIKLG
ncbi:hypothetical protein B484DRAFT_397135 [Ochromonadaceae sp. CCMP2298]|nr:hypothetical protein B484DRAFT_397135 [Ochromonadaceae sp. CCMP2298]